MMAYPAETRYHVTMEHHRAAPATVIEDSGCAGMTDFAMINVAVDTYIHWQDGGMWRKADISVCNEVWP